MTDTIDARTGLELAVVGTALLNPDQYKPLAEVVSADMLSHFPARAVWEQLEKRIPEGLPVDYASLGVALGAEETGRIGGPGVFARIGEHGLPVADWQADKLREMALREHARVELVRALERLNDDEDVHAAIEAANQRTARLVERAAASGVVPPQSRRIVLTPASALRARPVHWLWDTTPDGAPPTSHGRIPLYSLALAAGGPGLGKSQWAVWMAARITTGTLPGQLQGKPRAVIYAATEDSWTRTILPRLIASGADLDLVFRIDVQDDGKASARLTLPVDTSRLGEAAEAHGVALLVADPLLSLIDSSINDYRAAEVREALEPLVAAAERHGFTIVGLAHFTKAGGSDVLSRVAGSGAFGQLIRSLVAFAQQEDDQGDAEFVMSLEKNNLGRLGLPSYSYTIQPFTVATEEGPAYVSRFVLGGESSTSVRDALRAADGPPSADRAELSEAAAWLRDYLEDTQRGGEAPPKEIEQAARAAGITPTALRSAKARLKVSSVKPKILNASWVWRLPEASTEP
ncbi:AAA family ATPase [Kitasatospora purpeofusca]|uniref:AAA family ATPase n=1 Tax=Kitasatospora purpeofusca TaxID=67352 RepID=UPI0037F1DCB4